MNIDSIDPQALSLQQPQRTTEPKVAEKEVAKEDEKTVATKNDEKQQDQQVEDQAKDAQEAKAKGNGPVGVNVDVTV